MNTPSNEPKEKLIRVTLEMINEGTDPEKITTRDIAARAGLNIALINYYFQSKDNLIQQAIGIRMQDIAGAIFDINNPTADPVENLRSMLKKNSELALQYRFLMKKAIEFELKNGSAATVQTIMPVLREIFPGQKTERELQLIALQLLVPLQTMFLHHETYQKNWGLDLFRKEEFNLIIDTLIANLLSNSN